MYKISKNVLLCQKKSALSVVSDLSVTVFTSLEPTLFFLKKELPRHPSLPPLFKCVFVSTADKMLHLTWKNLCPKCSFVNTYRELDVLDT